MNIQDIMKAAAISRTPLHCQIEITRACNLKCKHCYIPNESRSIMHPNSFLKYVKEIRKEGCRFLTITGGEPFTHPEFSLLYNIANDEGCYISVYSNGFSLTNEHLSTLIQHPPRFIEISIYGSNDDVYYHVTGKNNVFHTVIENITRLKEAEINVRLKTFITKENYSDFSNIKSLILSLSNGNENQSVLYDYKMLPQLDGNIENLKHRISPQEAFELIIKEDPYARIRWKERINSPIRFKSGRSECGCGMQSFQINVDGMVSTCTFNKYSSEDLNRYPFSLIWQKFGEKIREHNEGRYRESKCNNCKYSNVCDVCPAITYSETNTEYGNDAVPYQCEIAKLRYEYANNVEEMRIQI